MPGHDEACLRSTSPLSAEHSFLEFGVGRSDERDEVWAPVLAQDRALVTEGPDAVLTVVGAGAACAHAAERQAWHTELEHRDVDAHRAGGGAGQEGLAHALGAGEHVEGERLVAPVDDADR